MTDKPLNENLKISLKSEMVEKGILSGGDLVKPSMSSPVETPAGLTFENRRNFYS